MSKIIHVGKVHLPKRRGSNYAILREISPKDFRWFIEDKGQEKETGIKGESIPQAIHNAKKRWKDSAFNPMHCGIRFELPERDQHGTKALFYQMIQSQRHNNGVYFDIKLNQQCIVQNISNEALLLMSRWEKEGKLGESA